MQIRLTGFLGMLFIVAALRPEASWSQVTPAVGWTPEIMLQVRRVGSVRPSPDGRRVVFTITGAVMTPVGVVPTTAVLPATGS